jgi:NADH-quinone oxidoreductase subunit N
MEIGLTEKLEGLQHGLAFFVPEVIMSAGIFFILLLGIISLKKKGTFFIHLFPLLIFAGSLLFIVVNWSIYRVPVKLFGGMVRSDDFSAYLKVLIDLSGLFTVVMSWRKREHQKHISEYYALILSIVLGAHLLVMSTNAVIVFLSLELISIPSYVLAGFSFTKKGAEGSLKYFLFGSVASAIMLYGLSILYGITGTLDFSSHEFVTQLAGKNSLLVFTSAFMVLVGFLYKIAAAPMHLWAPDIYEASPTPVVAFFSVVPKLAGIGILTKFLLAINVVGHVYDWQVIISVIAMLSLTVGNFSALKQKYPKRMMAYSSIAQSGFLLVGVAAFLPHATHFMLFYASVYMLSNFLVFFCLNYFESLNITSISDFAGAGKTMVWPSILLCIGFVALTGLPPTAGFTAKLFIFSSLWDAYALSGKYILLWLLAFGLLNTVISLFYYLRIPYFAFIKSNETLPKPKNSTFENLFGFILVLIILTLFFLPGLLMGWINKINFVL